MACIFKSLKQSKLISSAFQCIDSGQRNKGGGQVTLALLFLFERKVKNNMLVELNVQSHSTSGENSYLLDSFRFTLHN